MSASLVQEKTALPGGVIMTDTGKKVNILDRREDNYWDTVIIGDRTAPYVVPAATQVIFFQNVSTKGLQYSAFTQDNQIINNEQILVTKMGLVPKNYWGNTAITDASIKRAYDSSYVEFRKNENTKKKGPPVLWQAGYGMAGGTVEVGDYFCSVGVPSPAAIPDFLKPFELYDSDTIEGWVTFPNSQMADTNANAYIMATLATPVMYQMIMHGFIVRSGLRD